MRTLPLLVLAGCSAPSVTRPAETSVDWHGRAIYFVVTDRFANGNPANDADADRADPKAWHGGDFQGVIDRLDYIAGMGFTGIWITPIIEQHDHHAYHGYWGWEWSRVDPHLGDAAKLRELVDRAHAKGIAVMIDTVANHTGRYDYASPSFPDRAMYHHEGEIKSYADPIEVETHDLAGLNDLAQENPVVRARLLDHVRWLVHAGADGLRVDTVKHVPVAFWRDYQAAAGVFTIGEVLDGAVDKVAPYSHVLSATLDYPLYFAIRDVFGKGDSASKLGRVFVQDGAYRDTQLSGVFIDNHDQPRFLCGSNIERLRLALAFAYTVRGIPIVYYGTEQEFASCSDNRQDMFHSDRATPLYRYIATLAKIRASHEALRTGTQHALFWQDDTAYAFERVAGASVAVVAFNLGTDARSLRLLHVDGPPNMVLHDALGSGTVTVDAGSVAVTVPAMSVAILTN